MNKDEKTDNIQQVYNKFGSAQGKYLKEEDLSFREKVFNSILNRSRNYNQQFNLTGGKRFKKRSEQLHKQAYRFRYCGYEYLKLQCNSCSQAYISRNRCESRICTHCSKKIGAKARKSINNLLGNIKITHQKRIMHLVVTQKHERNYEPNEFDVRRLGNNVKKLMHKLYPKKVHECGAFGVIEMGEKGNGLHMHLIVYGYFYPQKYISKVWKEITGDSDIVNIREVDGIKKCVNYLLKYVTKPPDYNNPNQLALYLDALTGTRRIRTYGLFYNFPIMKKNLFPCVKCGGLLMYGGTDGGLGIPLDAMFIEDAVKTAC